MIYKLYQASDNKKGAYGTTDDGRFVSFIFDENNPDYQTFLAWVAEGNAPLPIDEPPPAPPEPTIDEKLASVGLTLDDLKTALGIK